MPESSGGSGQSISIGEIFARNLLSGANCGDYHNAELFTSFK